MTVIGPLLLAPAARRRGLEQRIHPLHHAASETIELDAVDGR
jgi:hypothetical protein